MGVAMLDAQTLQALGMAALGCGFTWFMTTAGSAVVFLTGRDPARGKLMHRIFLGFAILTLDEYKCSGNVTIRAHARRIEGDQCWLLQTEGSGYFEVSPDERPYCIQDTHPGRSGSLLLKSE